MDSLSLIQDVMRKSRHPLIHQVLMRAYWHSRDVSVGTEESSVKRLFAERSRIRAKRNRQAKEQAYRSCGLVKVRGALGGTYWE